MTEPRADVIVIGAGPAGSAATWRLAKAGFSVICLERGHWFDYSTLGHGTPFYERRRAKQFNDNPNIRRNADDYPIDDTDSPIKPMIGNAVGGGSIYWAAHIPRYRPEDFRVRSLDGVGDDWPIAYDDLAPYYDINEAETGLAAFPGDPSGPLRQQPVVAAPTIGPAGRRLGRAFDSSGWHWWPVDLTVGSAGAARATCTHPGPCEPGCPSRVQAGADATYMRKAIAAGARLMTGARVIGLEHDADQCVTAAIVATDTGILRVRGDRFVLAANGIGTPRLLLMSASARFPNGLANGSGLVGRNLMLHPHARVDGWFDERLGAWAPGQKAGIVSLEFYATRCENGFPRGFKMQSNPGPAPADLARGAAIGSRLPWGSDHHASFERAFDHTLGLTICIEDLPEPANRITLADDLVDRDGAPAPKMTYLLSDASRRNLDFAMDRAEEILRKAGAKRIARDPLKQQAGFHLMGTTRMGTAPETSVVDPYGRCHGVPNLFIVDSSVFVTGGAMNPTSTAQAFALRTADHLAATSNRSPPAPGDFSCAP
ncbi:GMC family oxidoreductase [Microvirga antarctica]|uniref:GMC family oxidoreductase n=1 Tax=Microvirga antarctica TaxID=2819233 RepID=UPI001B304DDA|nr:GMC family oxidoreductase [Microvirga antarctica]